MVKLEMYMFRADWWVHQLMNHIFLKRGRPRCYAKSPAAQDAFQPLPGQLRCLLSHYLRVSDADGAFYETILFRGL